MKPMLLIGMPSTLKTHINEQLKETPTLYFFITKFTLKQFFSNIDMLFVVFSMSVLNFQFLYHLCQIFSGTGPLNRDYDDVRRFADAAKAGIKRCAKFLLIFEELLSIDFFTVVISTSFNQPLYCITYSKHPL